MKRDQEELTFSLNTLYNLQHEWWCLLKECVVLVVMKKGSCDTASQRTVFDKGMYYHTISITQSKIPARNTSLYNSCKTVVSGSVTRTKQIRYDNDNQSTPHLHHNSADSTDLDSPATPESPSTRSARQFGNERLTSRFHTGVQRDFKISKHTSPETK